MKRMKAILPAMSPAYEVVEIRPEKIQAHTGFEPMASVMLV